MRRIFAFFAAILCKSKQEAAAATKSPLQEKIEQFSKAEAVASQSLELLKEAIKHTESLADYMLSIGPASIAVTDQEWMAVTTPRARLVMLGFGISHIIDSMRELINEKNFEDQIKAEQQKAANAFQGKPRDVGDILQELGDTEQTATNQRLVQMMNELVVAIALDKDAVTDEQWGRLKSKLIRRAMLLNAARKTIEEVRQLLQAPPQNNKERHFIKAPKTQQVH